MDTMMWVILSGAGAGRRHGCGRVAIVAQRPRAHKRAAMLGQLAFEPEPALNERAFQAPIEMSFEPSFGATVGRRSSNSTPDGRSGRRGLHGDWSRVGLRDLQAQSEWQR